jgi:hypothetical protein
MRTNSTKAHHPQSMSLILAIFFIAIALTAHAEAGSTKLLAAGEV